MTQIKGRQTNSRPNQVPKINNNPRYSNWAGAFRDILVASLNKGQFPIAVVLVIFVVIFWRLPPTDLKSILVDFLNRFENNYILGWALFIVTLFGWYFHNRYVRKVHSNEINRILQEKKDLQELLLNKNNK